MTVEHIWHLLTCHFLRIVILFATAGLLGDDLVVGLLAQYSLLHLAFVVSGQVATMELFDIGRLNVVSPTELVYFLEKKNSLY